MQRKSPSQVNWHQRYKWQLYLLAAVLLLLVTTCSGVQDDNHTSHQEPTAPAQHADHDQHTVASDEEAFLAMIAKSTNRYVVSDQKTIKVGVATGEAEFSGTGYIRTDERRSAKVAARFDGRIEDLHVKYNYAYVRRGQPILELYSPQLNTMQQELRYLRQHPEDNALLEQARQRLRLLGLSDRQITKLEITTSPKTTVQIESPAEGYVLFAGASAAPAMELKATDQKDDMGSMSGMGESTGSTRSMSGSGEGTLRKGRYVRAGQTLFEVNDFREVWAILSVDARHASQLREGLPVKVYDELQPGKFTAGKINLIEPVYEPGQKFVTVRVYLPNKDLRFKANSLVTATIAGSSRKGLTVPNSAVMDLGRKHIVWVLTGKAPHGKKVFEAREVKAGSTSALTTEIISGLTAGQEVASDAGLLADSEGFIDATRD